MCELYCSLSICLNVFGLDLVIGVARGGPEGPCPPKIFRKYSHFVL